MRFATTRQGVSYFFVLVGVTTAVTAVLLCSVLICMWLYGRCAPLPASGCGVQKCPAELTLLKNEIAKRDCELLAKDEEIARKDIEIERLVKILTRKHCPMMMMVLFVLGSDALSVCI